MNHGSKAKQAYDKQYGSRPDQIAKRSQRNKARRLYEAKNGDLPQSVDVDHKRMIKDGGTNNPSNLRATSQTTNRGWRKGKKGYD